MEVKDLAGLIKESKQYKELLARYKELTKEKTPLPLLVDGVSDGAFFALAYSLISDIRAKAKSPLLLLTGEERRGYKLNEFLQKCGVKSEFYPKRDFNFYDLTASHELEHERLKTLSGITLSSLDVVIATPDSALQFTMPQKELKKRSIYVNLDTPLDISDFSRQLYDLGYTQAEAVEGPGQYAVRGGIIDIFPTKCEYTKDGNSFIEQKPIRIELFGDEIDRLVTFDTQSQRMVDKIDSFLITPSREIIINNSQRGEIKSIIEELLVGNKSEASVTELKRELASLSTEDSSYPFLDKLVSYVYKDSSCLFDYFSKDSTVIVADSSSVSAKAKSAMEEENEIANSLIESQLLPSKYANFSAPVSIIDKFIRAHQSIYIDPFIMSRLDMEGGIYRFNTKGVTFANHSLGSVIEELSYFAKNKYKTILICQTDTEAKSTVKMLNEEDIPAFLIKDKKELKAGTVGVISTTFPSGFEIPESKLALVVLSSKARTDKKKSVRLKSFSKNAGEKILSYNDLNVGDLVVHIKHGIGRYLGIQNLFVMGAHRDYIAIQYSGAEKLYLPVDQLDMVAKYIGSGSNSGTVKLSKMGGAEWKRATTKAKTAAKDMAKQLIDLYARRTRTPGYAFLPDDLMEREFDSSFEFEETESQLVAISEIKSDMERPYPMDRVLCGDVGYGKTEVAFRGAMKAVANNKQVAILVPTTILAMQHYQTALARFAGTGVTVDMLSRFRTAKEQRKILERLKNGDLDIIIGTHKLLGSKVVFKDLGLLIVDEEQRFGVAQKEKIKEAFPQVDALTLSATPIPRTLSMAMGGIRDLSVLDEAPLGRVGIQSYVLEHDDNIVNDAIKRELHRGGQVFYLHNSVDDIYYTASKLQKAFPDAVVAVGHGQMDKDSLEEIWHRLVLGEVDILVSTTIIETGIDIPNANTLIIENADRMGLSQLHQIRGRVGRSHRRAYALFTYRRGKELSEVARQRLSAIRDFCEFGAGFKIAMKDLEIRGAGNLLGAEQHGHLDAVGYDLYIRLLNEAVLEEKGQAVPDELETKMVISLDAFLPEYYVESPSQRMELYKKIAHIKTEEDLLDIENELTDRFGKMPREAKNLFSVAIVKAYAQRAKFKKVEQLRAEVRLYPSEVNLPLFVEISQFDRKNVQICGIKQTPYISVKHDPSEDFSKRALEVIKFYIQKSNN
ncbi:MAG: transcription-repair coupling factor [Clostridia bacterium]|nr:transcription-repair coupling factor [Clostridia bacterium]